LLGRCPLYRVPSAESVFWKDPETGMMGGDENQTHDDIGRAVSRPTPAGARQIAASCLRTEGGESHNER